MILTRSLPWSSATHCNLLDRVSLTCVKLFIKWDIVMFSLSVLTCVSSVLSIWGFWVVFDNSNMVCYKNTVMNVEQINFISTIFISASILIVFTLILLMFCCIVVCASCTLMFVSFRVFTVAPRSLIWLPNVATLVDNSSKRFGKLAISGAAWKYSCILCKSCWMCANCKSIDPEGCESFRSVTGRNRIIDVTCAVLPVP